ncbi:hypothetical protein BDW22DRAFT_1429431 [Trametopsis cervina]|nr:hypothetical protein BDW22DRAFT_1429431 [Trametopsis cervina]
MTTNTVAKGAVATANENLLKNTPPLPAPQSFEERDKVPSLLIGAKDDNLHYIPGLMSLGASYDVLNGKYADAKSSLQQIIDWSQAETKTQTFGGKEYKIPKDVSYNDHPTAGTHSFHGKTLQRYASSLSSYAEIGFPGFAGSAVTDFSETERDDLSRVFTRVEYAVLPYKLALPPLSGVRPLLKPSFVDDIEKKDPVQLFKQYGTHILGSLAVGGRALFLSSTDVRTYTGTTYSIEAAAKLSTSYSMVPSMSLTPEQEQAIKSFNEASTTTIATKGGDPKYSNENFLKNVEAWSKSIKDFPEFVELGSRTSFRGIWELATTKDRQDALKDACAGFVQLAAKDLSIHGPFVEARLSNSFDYSINAYISVNNNTGHIALMYPKDATDTWYMVSSGLGGTAAVLGQELVPGALAPVTWEEAFVGPYYSSAVTRVWRAVPPTSDYYVFGCVAMTGDSADTLPKQPPASLAGRFRAVHKCALTQASVGVANWHYDSNPPDEIYAVDYRYWNAGTALPKKEDCLVFDSKNARKDWNGW